MLEAEFVENEVNVIPITYPFATSHIWWPINHAEEFNIKFDFRSSRPGAVLAYSDVTTSAGNGFWEVSVSIQAFIPYTHCTKNFKNLELLTNIE